jgi:glycosyltransferase involved in cell wall biosynthesis
VTAGASNADEDGKEKTSRIGNFFYRRVVHCSTAKTCFGKSLDSRLHNEMNYIIAIDGSRAFLRRRTGIEEYSYQVIRHLCDQLRDARVVLYIRADQSVDFDVPENWTVKKLWAPRFWTQIRLSLQMLADRPGVLFVPAHTVPLIHPARNAFWWTYVSLSNMVEGLFSGKDVTHSDAGGPKRTVVVVHGLEYEFCPRAYSFWARLYMRWSIRFSCRAAERIVAVSENTKRDVMRLYGVAEEKISVVYEGYEMMIVGEVLTDEGHSERSPAERVTVPVPRLGRQASERPSDNPYFLFVGRLEERKNIARIVEAFGLLKEKYGVPQKLVLAGKPGYGYEKVVDAVRTSAFREDIVELGYVSEEEKWNLLRGAEAFVFPTLYEGFGIPVLEAQASGLPVIASDVSSLPEVAGDAALLVNPQNVEEITEAMQKLISDKGLKNAIIQKGLENVKRFSWKRCARELAAILRGK